MGAADPVIRVRNLAKRFDIYRHPSDLFLEIVTRRCRHREFWALHDVSFDVHRGEIVGLMGRNGAGKSTLLKILSGTLEATGGDAVLNGRMAAILELGMGFNTEYTGRENIYMGGLCMGLTRQEIDRRLEWIVDFSELGDVIDQSLKTYSTGMQSRLAFSTATCIDPDILIVDEALSVGDARFQKKCFDQFRAFRDAGKTIILVSHATQVITTMCDRAILLEDGRVAADDRPSHVTKFYHRMLFGEGDGVMPAAAPGGEGPSPSSTDAIAVADADASSVMRYGDKKAEIAAVSIEDAQGQGLTSIRSGQRCTLVAHVAVHEDVEEAVVGFLVRDAMGVDLYGTDTGILEHPLRALESGARLEVRLDVSMWVTRGDYFLTVGIARPNGVQYDLRHDALQFDVTGDDTIYTDSKVNLDATLTIVEQPKVDSPVKSRVEKGLAD